MEPHILIGLETFNFSSKIKFFLNFRSFWSIVEDWDIRFVDKQVLESDSYSLWSQSEFRAVLSDSAHL